MSLEKAIGQLEVVSNEFTFTDSVGGVDRADLSHLLDHKEIPVQASCTEMALLAAYFLQGGGLDVKICETQKKTNTKHIRCAFQANGMTYLILPKAGRYLISTAEEANEAISESYDYNGESTMSEIIGAAYKLKIAGLLRRVMPRYWPLDINRRKNLRKMTVFNKRSQKVFLSPAVAAQI